jgi:hypothetical protein
MCGKRSLNWDSVVASAVHSMVKHVNTCCTGFLAQKDHARACRRLMSPLYRLMQDMDTIRQSIQRGNAPALLPLLKIYRDRGATDPRDKIYALLGIAGDLSIYDIWPDYNVPFQEVLNLTLGLSKSSELPSWTPDWRVSPTDSKKIEMNYMHEKNLGGYRACGRMPFLVSRKDANLLCVNGIYFDEVAELSDVIDTEDEKALNQILGSWEAKIALLQGAIPYRGGGDWIEAYFRTMTADLIAALRAELVKDGLMMDGLTSRLITVPAESLKDPDIVQTAGGDGLKRIASLRIGFQNRRLFISKRGYLGTVPGETQLGDSVHILCAAKTPMILRAGKVLINDRNLNGFQVVGDAYVHGIMNGEALNEMRPFRPHFLY